ncbi:MAG: hypothetical protein ACNYPD_06650 [Candidatus Halichondribacter symbioticus]
MKLYDHLKRAKSEEDVKDIYIRELWLTKVSKGLIDIKSNEAWFEAKMGGSVSYYAMFTQLLHYVNKALEDGEYTPPLLAVVDQQKAALIRTSDVRQFLKNGTIKWGKSASQFTQETLDEVSKYISTYFVQYDIETQSDLFIQRFMHARQHDDFLRTPIVPKNLKKIFKIWMEAVGSEIANVKKEEDYARLFFADLMNDGEKPVQDELPAEFIISLGRTAFLLDGTRYRIGNINSYRNFWMIYDRPPAKKFWKRLLERGDSLIPDEKRKFEGAYFTPDWVVAKAYDTLAKTLGKDWQQKYTIWDMCCGYGNLENSHENLHNVFLSSLDKADIATIKSSKICAGAKIFQYDYLNDDITDDGKIDYSLNKNKIPQELQDAIKNDKQILVLMNPPYAEAPNSQGNAGKTGVAQTRLSQTAMQDYGKASKELYTQFLTRISIEMPTATIAMFSTLKYVNAPNFEEFRQNWNAEYKDGFIVHSKAFDGLKGNFPIGFLIWKTHHGTKKNYTIDKISIEAFDKNNQYVERKDFYNLPNEKMLNKWIDRPKANKTPALPLKNAIVPATSKPRVKHCSDGAIGYMYCNSNDIQNARKQTAITSSVFGTGNGFYVTPDNFVNLAMIFTARRIIKPTWINDRDQFLIPTEPLTDEFKNDCLIWMLFSGSNLTAGADGLEWDGKDWSLVNHFIPFNAGEVDAERFQSNFMADYLKGKTLSAEANEVMTQGRALWKTFFAITDTPNILDKYKINRSDAGWYQIRNALKERNEKSDAGQTDFTAFNQSYERLSDKLHPMVFDLGFLAPNN